MQFLDVKTDYAFKKVFGSENSKNELETQYKRKEFISIYKLAILKATHDGLSQGMIQNLRK